MGEKVNGMMLNFGPSSESCCCLPEGESACFGFGGGFSGVSWSIEYTGCFLSLPKPPILLRLPTPCFSSTVLGTAIS